MLITDLQGTIIHVNHALEKLTGYDRQELLGQTPRLLKSGVHPPEFYARMEGADGELLVAIGGDDQDGDGDTLARQFL